MQHLKRLALAAAVVADPVPPPTRHGAPFAWAGGFPAENQLGEAREHGEAGAEDDG